jgi:hypothetical protein
MYIAACRYDFSKSGAQPIYSGLLSQATRARGTGVPDAGSCDPHCEQWTSGRLLFSQACRYDCLLPYSGISR